MPARRQSTWFDAFMKVIQMIGAIIVVLGLGYSVGMAHRNLLYQSEKNSREIIFQKELQQQKIDCEKEKQEFRNAEIEEMKETISKIQQKEDERGNKDKRKN